MNWCWWVRESEAPKTTHQYAVLCALASYANDDGQCWPSHDQIARVTHMSRSSIKRSIKALEEAGALTVEPGLGRGNRTTYTLNAGTIKGSTQNPFTDIKGSTQNGKRVHTEHKPTKTLINEVTNEVPTHTPPSLPPNGHGGDEGFDEFKRMYPKKVHVAEARKVWLTMSAEDRAAALVAIGGNPWRRYFEAERHRNSYQYAPNMAAWLEKRRWEDDAYPKPLPRNAVTEDWDTGAGWINDDGTAKQFWQD